MLSAKLIYSGTNWVAEYTGTEIELSNYAKLEVQGNLLKDTIFIDGYYLANGGPAVLPSFSFTEKYYPVVQGQKFRVKTGAIYTGEFYNGDKNFMVNITSADGAANPEFTVPSGAFFMRLNVPISGREDFYVVESEKLGFKEVENLDLSSKLDKENVSLFNGSTLKSGYFLLDGVETAASGYSYTQDYILVEGGKFYSGKIGSGYAGAIYDINKKFIGNLSAPDYQINPTYLLPGNARFVRLNISNDFKGLNYFTKTEDLNKSTSADLVVLNKPSELRTSLGSLNVNTFIGAYNFVIKQIMQAKPKARIVIVLHYSNDASDKTDLWYKTIQCQRHISEALCIPVIDMVGNSNIFNRNGVSNFSQLLPDGIHPATDDSGECVQRLADIAYSKLKDLFDDWIGKKVAWYGTSIPAGYPKQANQNVWSYANKAVAKLGGTIQNFCVPNGVIRKAKHDGTTMGVRDYLSLTNLNSGTNYQNTMLDLIGTASEPDLFVLDYSVNDYDADPFDIDMFDKNNPY